MNKQAGGVVLAFAGFVFIVGAFKGTWRNTIDALLGKTASAAPPPGGGTTTTPTTPAGSGLPGGAPHANPLASAGK